MAAAALLPPASRGGLRAASSSAGFRGTQSAPNIRRTLHHRGEGQFGVVNGFETVDEDLYVPQASWTESFNSPLKRRYVPADADDGKSAAESHISAKHKAAMTQYVKLELSKTIKEQDQLRATLKDVQVADLRRTIADVAKLVGEEAEQKDSLRKTQESFRSGLGEQVAHHAVRLREKRLQEAYEGAETKFRATQQLCQELAKASKQKEQLKQEMLQSIESLEASKRRSKAEQERENERLRLELRGLTDEQGEPPSRTKVKGLMVRNEDRYKHFSATTGAEDQERFDRQARRVEHDITHHQMRMDLHYSQREMARENQRHKMIQTLARQVEAKAYDPLTGLQRQMENIALDESKLQAMEKERRTQQTKRAKELENQAMLVAQMHEKQQRAKREDPLWRPKPAVSTMMVTPSLLASAEGWRSGKGGTVSPDLVTSMDAPLHVEKPMGKPEVKPWVDIANSAGLGGVVGMFGSDGPTRSVLMSTGGPQRLLAKSMEGAARDKQQKTKWRDGVTPEALKAGRKAAALRESASAADKAVAPP